MPGGSPRLVKRARLHQARQKHSGLFDLAKRIVAAGADTVGDLPLFVVPHGAPGTRQPVRARTRATVRDAVKFAGEQSGVTPGVRVAGGRGGIGDVLALAGLVPSGRLGRAAALGYRELLTKGAAAPARRKVAHHMWQQLQRGHRQDIALGASRMQRLVSLAEQGALPGVRRAPNVGGGFRLTGGASPTDARIPWLVDPKGRIVIGHAGQHHHQLVPEDVVTGGSGWLQGEFQFPWDLADESYMRVGGWAGHRPTRRQLAAINRWMYAGRR